MINKYKKWVTFGNSEATVIAYVQRVKHFLNKVSVNNINEENIFNYLLELKQTNSASTVNGYRCAIKSLLKYLKKDISLPKQLKIVWKFPEFITKEMFENEVIRVVECIFKNPLKVKAILYFLFFTGVRESELASLQRKNIDLEKRTAKIFNKKGRSEKLVLFTEKVRDIISNYFSMESEVTSAFNISSNAIKKTFQKLKPHFKEVNLHAHMFRHCVSEDTEILTEKGWENYKDLKIGEKIFTYNSVKNIIELSPLLNIHKYKYKGKMYNLFNHWLDCLVSPNHKNILKIGKQKQKKYIRYTNWNKKWDLKTIPELIKTVNKRLIRTLIGGKYNGQYSIGKIKSALLGWIMTDGRISKRDRNILITQSLSANAKKCKIIENLLIKSNLKYSKCIQKIRISPFSKKHSKMIYFRIKKKSCKWVYKWLNYDRTPKYKLLHLKYKELQILYQNIMLGDGTKSKEFTGQNKKIIDFFRILVTLINYRSVLKWSGLENKFRTYITYKGNCNLLLDKHIKIVSYKGTIWCPSTKNKTWIAKRKEKIFITGNSYATHLRSKGFSIEDIKELLGHKSIQSTMRYAHADMKKIKEKYDKKIK